MRKNGNTQPAESYLTELPAIVLPLIYVDIASANCIKVIKAVSSQTMLEQHAKIQKSQP